MNKAKQNNNAPAYFYKGHFIDVSYSFSACAEKDSMSSDKVWLHILFMHPESQQAIMLQVVQPALILCQSKEVIEGIVHREIYSSLHFSDSVFLTKDPVAHTVTAA